MIDASNHSLSRLSCMELMEFDLFIYLFNVYILLYWGLNCAVICFFLFLLQSVVGLIWVH